MTQRRSGGAAKPPLKKQPFWRESEAEFRATVVRKYDLHRKSFALILCCRPLLLLMLSISAKGRVHAFR